MDALQAEADGVTNLHSLLEEYFGVTAARSADTHEPLFGFATMMPKSRTQAGIRLVLRSRPFKRPC